MNQQPRKKEGHPRRLGEWRDKRREIRPTFQAWVTKALTMAWAACHSPDSSSPSDFISFLSPALFTCSSLCGFSTHQILDTLSHEDISWLGNSSPRYMHVSLSLLLQGFVPRSPLCWALHPPYFYQVLLCTKYYFLT